MRDTFLMVIGTIWGAMLLVPACIQIWFAVASKPKKDIGPWVVAQVSVHGAEFLSINYTGFKVYYVPDIESASIFTTIEEASYEAKRFCGAALPKAFFDRKESIK